jgi:hypothetical protein
LDGECVSSRSQRAFVLALGPHPLLVHFLIRFAVQLLLGLLLLLLVELLERASSCTLRVELRQQSLALLSSFFA